MGDKLREEFNSSRIDNPMEILSNLQKENPGIFERVRNAIYTGAVTKDHEAAMESGNFFTAKRKRLRKMRWCLSSVISIS